jgi:hypothetical protein
VTGFRIVWDDSDVRRPLSADRFWHECFDEASWSQIRLGLGSSRLVVL